MYFAHDLVFLTITRILAMFDILKAVDEATGNEITPEAAFTSGVTRCASAPPTTGQYRPALNGALLQPC